MFNFNVLPFELQQANINIARFIINFKIQTLNTIIIVKTLEKEILLEDLERFKAARLSFV